MQYSAALTVVFAAALALAAPAQFQGTPDTQYKEPYNNRNYINPGQINYPSQINNYNPPAAYFPPGTGNSAPARFNTYGPPAPLNSQATPSNSESEVPPVPVYDENQVQQYSDQLMMVD
ncbi:hypothetical protein DCS_06326 [Drechmeria coniospora]|uniref:Uncharacterized protein n=1 Tax=Drechmeria coniospora TaxID=98403 RepID=A0A151GB87_DRECN|nr:hypothetical protein DCS_06326 [Drechmeria coniospora]KYK54368.1 hypothetical protein DCS_06326 [Drechmeria coniospora]ODA77639.1 hypothetical protein RJ55_07268 [Drechmeria coniospora]